MRIKICGIRDVATAQAVAQAGADALGLVFYPPSPRHVELAQAADIVRSIPPFVSSVGLFVNESELVVSQILRHAPLDLLQFHGDESPAYCQQFARPFIKAVRVKPGLDLLEYARAYADPAGWCRGLLVDAYVPGVPGGTGEGFDWDLLPANLPLPLILSGGLHPGNVAQAVEQVAPWALDVSSGVEGERGVKDLALVAEFIRTARTAELGRTAQ